MSENLTTEDKKKAINLEDLVYVKKYIDKHQDDYETKMNTNYESFKEEVNTSNNSFKEEMNSDYESFKTETNASIETKVADEIDSHLEGIKNGTTTVSKADDATTIQGVDLAGDDTAEFGDFVISKKKLVWSGDVELKIDPNLYAFYVNMVQIPSALIEAIEVNCRYRMVGYQTNNSLWNIPFECEFITGPALNNGDSIRITGDICRLPSVPTVSGDLALFSANGTIIYGTSMDTGEYGYVGSSSSFELRLATMSSDKMAADNSHTYGISKLYKIIE